MGDPPIKIKNAQFLILTCRVSRGGGRLIFPFSILKKEQEIILTKHLLYLKQIHFPTYIIISITSQNLSEKFTLRPLWRDL